MARDSARLAGGGFMRSVTDSAVSWGMVRDSCDIAWIARDSEGRKQASV